MSSEEKPTSPPGGTGVEDDNANVVKAADEKENKDDSDSKNNDPNTVSPDMVKPEIAQEQKSDVPKPKSTSAGTGATPAMINASIRRNDISRTKRPQSDRLSLNPSADDMKQSIAAAREKAMPILEVGADLSEDLKAWFTAVTEGDTAEVTELLDSMDVNIRNDVSFYIPFVIMSM